jgi:hypothetical protein
MTSTEMQRVPIPFIRRGNSRWQKVFNEMRLAALDGQAVSWAGDEKAFATARGSLYSRRYTQPGEVVHAVHRDGVITAWITFEQNGTQA